MARTSCASSTSEDVMLVASTYSERTATASRPGASPLVSVYSHRLSNLMHNHSFVHHPL